MTKQLTAIIEREGDGYVASCPELDIASQGNTIAEAKVKLAEALARIHRRDTVLALTWGMMGTGRRTDQAGFRQMELRVVRGGHAGGKAASRGGASRRNRPGRMPEATLADWAGMNLRGSPWIVRWTGRASTARRQAGQAGRGMARNRARA